MIPIMVIKIWKSNIFKEKWKCDVVCTWHPHGEGYCLINSQIRKKVQHEMWPAITQHESMYDRSSSVMKHNVLHPICMVFLSEVPKDVKKGTHVSLLATVYCCGSGA